MESNLFGHYLVDHIKQQREGGRESRKCDRYRNIVLLVLVDILISGRLVGVDVYGVLRERER